MKYTTPILLVDDDKEILKIYEKIFKINKFNIIVESNSEKAIQIIMEREISVVISDIIMPKMDGNELLKIIKNLKSEIEVIMLTAEGSVDGAVDSMKNGAFDYLLKPVDIEKMLQTVKNAYSLWKFKKKNMQLKEIININASSDIYLGKSKSIRKINTYISRIAESNSSVLILGESGTGKEVLARQIHNNSLRKEEIIVSVNCASLSNNLIESELFGYEKGAFTGAEKRKIGRFELADGGTLFLDEIGDMPLNMQVKLLRVLQEKKFERVGGTDEVASDFRLIAATNVSLKEAVENGSFREDLYYRLNVIQIDIPPLRERDDDILELFYFFVNQFSKEINKEIKKIDDGIIQAILEYKWPGNIRELKNVVERLIVLSLDGELEIENLPSDMKEMSICYENEQINIAFDAELKEAVKEFEKIFIQKKLNGNNGNVSKTAQQLGIARNNLYTKLKDLEVLR